MLRGLTTVTYWAADVPAAVAWYTELLGVEPYFDREGAYVEFRIGDYQHELGILDSRYRPEGAAGGPGGVVVYWHVDDIGAAYERALALGATEHEKPVDRGEAFVTATVVDPFGNVLGLMANPHYLEVLASRPGTDRRRRGAGRVDERPDMG